MTFKQWKESLWRLDHDIRIPHLAVSLVTPWVFVRAMWHYNKRPFPAWPSVYETGVVVGWRWPFGKRFREHTWMTRPVPLPKAIYGAPMDMVYLERVSGELAVDHWEPMPLTVQTLKAILALEPKCNHGTPDFWIADCPNCARKALRYAVSLAKSEGTVPRPGTAAVEAGKDNRFMNPPGWKQLGR